MQTKKNHKKTVLYITDEQTNSFAIRCIQSVNSSLEKFGYQMLLLPDVKITDASEISELNRIYDLFNHFEISGIIVNSDVVCKISKPLRAKLIEHLPVPLIALGRACDVGDIFSIFRDPISGITDVLDHLLDVHNVKKIGYLNNANPTFRKNFEDRFEIIKQHMKSRGVTINDNWVSETVHPFFDPLSKKPTVEVIFCNNDKEARELILFCSLNNISVPEDLKVIGFNNAIESILISPSITTIMHPIEEIGDYAASVIDSLINNRALSSPHTFTNRPIYRHSCGCLPTCEQLALDIKYIQNHSMNYRNSILANNLDLQSASDDSLKAIEKMRSVRMDELGRQNRILHLSIFEYLSPYSDTEFLGTNRKGAEFINVFHFDKKEDFVDSFDFVPKEESYEQSELLNIKAKDGVPICYPIRESDKVIGFIFVVIVDMLSYSATRIICEQLEQDLQKIRYLNMVSEANQKMRTAHDRLIFEVDHDNLTGVYNRKYVTEIIKRDVLDKTPFALMVLDLDNFKVINDLYGHKSGDDLLIAVANRLSKQIKAVDIIARMGGDEFIIALRKIDKIEEIIQVAKRILEGLGSEIFEATTMVKASIGIACYPLHGSSFEELLQKADAAMYESKRLGKNTFTLFGKSLQEQIIESFTLEKDLDFALLRNEFVLEYQGQYDMTGKLVGAEALLRWQHPSKGWLSPYRFIKVLENSKHLAETGFWVLEEICKMIAEIESTGKNIKVSANICPLQLKDNRFCDRLQDLILKYKISPSNLGIEITEGNILTNLQVTHELFDMGVTLSIDDFGTGYSSLKRLIDFPASTLKVDKSLIDYVALELLHQNEISPKQLVDARLLVGIIFEIAQPLQCPVIFEGVETESQVDFIREFGYERTQIQGFYFSKPISRDQFLIRVNDLP